MTALDTATSTRRRRLRHARPLLALGAAAAALTLPLLSLTANPASAKQPPDLKVKIGFVNGHGYAASIKNIGGSATGGFSTAVIANSQSKAVHVGSLQPGDTRIIELNYIDCQQPIVVWADPQQVVGDPHLANNSNVGQGGCLIDDGSHGVGISDE
jgi:hypothetical protein